MIQQLYPVLLTNRSTTAVAEQANLYPPTRSTGKAFHCDTTWLYVVAAAVLGSYFSSFPSGFGTGVGGFSSFLLLLTSLVCAVAQHVLVVVVVGANASPDTCVCTVGSSNCCFSFLLLSSQLDRFSLLRAMGSVSQRSLRRAFCSSVRG